MVEKYRIFPENAELKQQEVVQFCVFKMKEDGSEEKVGSVSWVEETGGGYIDQYGTLTAINSGSHTLKASFLSDDDDIDLYKEISLTTHYNVVSGNGMSINQKFLDSKIGALSERLREIRSGITEDGNDTPRIQEQIEEQPIQKKKVVTIKQIVAEEQIEPEKKKTVMGHTRALYRTLAENKDLVWLGFLCIFAVCFGCSVILMMNGFSIEKITAFLAMFFGLVISFFGKLYTPPGEISEAISDRILGVSDEDKVKKLETKLNKLTTRVQKKNPNQCKSFYKYTIDENSNSF